jgi:4-amino-4-deoxy-L-arabinose transferase-like glycosyltransferase
MSKVQTSRIRMRTLRWTDLAVFPLVLGLSILPLLWFGRNWEVNVDSSRYLLLGWNLVSGEGYTLFGEPYTLRGPGFPGLLGGLMLLFGRDVESLAWAVRLFALANPVLMYFLIKRIAGAIPGLLAAAMVTLFGLTSANSETFNVDAVQLTLYLLVGLVLLIGAQRNSAVLSLLSGLLLGTAILTKETSLVALPLAIFAALLLGFGFRGVLLHYVGVAVVCLPAWVWVWVVSGNIHVISHFPSQLVVSVNIGKRLANTAE